MDAMACNRTYSNLRAFTLKVVYIMSIGGVDWAVSRLWGGLQVGTRSGEKKNKKRHYTPSGCVIS